LENAAEVAVLARRVPGQPVLRQGFGQRADGMAVPRLDPLRRRAVGGEAGSGRDGGVPVRVDGVR
jgi:hypothetical protein